MEGFLGGIEAGDGSKEKDKRIWCFPRDATVRQARLVVEKYLRDNPAILHRPAGLIAGIALMLAFPCEK
jgi:Rap1a immunity proteins